MIPIYSAIHNGEGILGIVLLILGLASLAGAGYKLYLHDFPVAVGLLIFAVICLALYGGGV